MPNHILFYSMIIFINAKLICIFKKTTIFRRKIICMTRLFHLKWKKLMCFYK